MVTSPMYQMNAVRLKEFSSRTLEMSAALRRSGADVPEIIGCQAKFESGL